MKHFILLIILSVHALFAANILTHNIYERNNRVDMMLSFDSPYEGEITKKKENNSVILTLDNALSKNIAEENINSEILHTVKIIPYRNSTYVELTGDTDFDVIASKTVDGFGLRIRAQNSASPALTENRAAVEEKPLISPNVKDIDISYKYTLVILVLLGLILFLYFFKNKFLGTLNGKESWLFKPVKSEKKEHIKITHKKMIDAKNKLSLIEFKDKKYLVIIGTNGHLLLDKFDTMDIAIEDEGEENSDFDNVFQKNKQKLDAFIKENNKKLNAYKEKVSRDKSFFL